MYICIHINFNTVYLRIRLPDFWAMLTSLPADQISFFRTDFTQSITGNPYSNMAWDM